jgi:hypothetical protein
MGPFIAKINGTDKSKLPSTGPWSFLREYESPIVEDKLEKISDRGKNDAKVRCTRYTTCKGEKGDAMED